MGTRFRAMSRNDHRRDQRCLATSLKFGWLNFVHMDNAGKKLLLDHPMMNTQGRLPSTGGDLRQAAMVREIT